jgi:hypothetical protein
MDATCPNCGRPLHGPSRQASPDEIRRQIAELRAKIDRLENGELDVIAAQPGAPSCTICEQAPPGKPEDAQPGRAKQIWGLQQRIAELEQQLRAA